MTLPLRMTRAPQGISIWLWRRDLEIRPAAVQKGASTPHPPPMQL